MKRIHLISGPRNISTALMYSFAQRPDTTVVDEPFYACWLKQHGFDHPGREQTLASMSAEPEEVKETVVFADYPKQVFFLKNMAKHLEGLDTAFLNKLTNLFLIRDPASLINSFSKVVPDMDESEIGLKHAWQLFQQLKEAGKQPVVLNSDVLLKKPDVIMKKLCEALDIPFYTEMLQWQAGSRPEDGPWAKYWYGNVHKSTGLQPKPFVPAVVDKRYQPLLEEVLPCFEKLNEQAIR